MFVDRAEISVRAGEGGKGMIAFRKEKYNPWGGPSGGTGGRGGNIWFLADEGMSTLMDFRYKREYHAPRGEHGGPNDCTGHNGEDVVVRVPVGTVLRDAETGRLVADLTEKGQKVLVAEGGRGGRGNAAFANPTRQAPDFAEDGRPGQECTLQLELKLIADVGLVGFPNAGKSTLLSRVSEAHPKIADYPFTTLEPSLGIVSWGIDRSFVMADIPGIIEGAHEGKGLGLRFLRHIERTKVLLFVIECTREDPAAEYRTLLRELELYSPRLMEKPRIIALSKTDLLPPGERPHLHSIDGVDTVSFSAVSGEGVHGLVYRLGEMSSAGERS